jgi:hypothetical protein
MKRESFLKLRLALQERLFFSETPRWQHLNSKYLLNFTHEATKIRINVAAKKCKSCKNGSSHMYTVHLYFF